MTFQTVVTMTLAVTVFVAFLPAGFASGAEHVRPSPIAGSWYPGDKASLTQALDGYFAGVKLPAELREPPGRLVGLILPHAGYRYCGSVAAHGAALIKPGAYDRVLLLGLSHRARLHGASIPTYTHYETPLGRVPLDRKVCDALLAKDGFQSIDRLHAQEHSLEILLPWIQSRLTSFELVPIMVGLVDASGAETLAKAIRPFLTERTLLVASSDFVHYGRRFQYTTREPDVPGFITRVDMGGVACIEKLDASGFLSYCDRTGATICGRGPIAVLINALSPDVKAVKVAYAKSGDDGGDYSNSVSYVSMAFFANGKGRSADAALPADASAKSAEPDSKPASAAGTERDDALTDYEKKVILSIARQAVEVAAKERMQIKVPEELPDALAHLREQRGVFVTLHKKGRLRGCIGYIQSPVRLIEGVRDNAFSAALRDHRFRPLTPDELDEIDIEVSVLTPLKRVGDYREIVAGKHGVVVRRGSRQGVFLPQVAPEQGWSRDEMLEALCTHKAGLPGNAYRDPETELHVFEAEVFGEVERKKE